jgi:O-antigen/teichoic acid export membrane protein
MINVEESTPKGIGLKAIRSVAALGVRQIVVQGLNALTAIVLARLLSPSDFGLFAIVTFVLTFLVAFGDVGLGASLIREAEEPSEEDYRVVFTAQQLLVLAVVVVAWFVSPLLARAYSLPAHQAILFRLVALSLLFTSFRVIPSVRLERHLQFQKLAAVEIAQAVVFSGITITTALGGLGPLSFALGLLSRSVAGAAIINWVSPWRIAWHWDSVRIRKHLSFGIPYQGIAFTSLLKDSITPVFVGLVLGTSDVGYINWAMMVAAYPVMALMVLQRVYLPAFARMQVHKERLGEFVEKVILATNAVAAPLAVLTFVLIRPITLTVFGEKWLVALPLFKFFWLANIFVPTATPLLALLNSLGDSRTAFKFALVWMLATWVLGIPLILAFGALGFAIATVGVQFTNVILCRVAQARVRFRILPTVVPVWCVAAVIGLVAYLAMHFNPPIGIVGLAVYLVLGFSASGACLLGLYRSEARRVWGLVWSQG